MMRKCRKWAHALYPCFVRKSFSNKQDQSCQHQLCRMILRCSIVKQREDSQGNDTTSHLIFTEEENQISNLTYLPPLGKSDHAVLLFEFVCEHYELKPSTKYQFHKADYRLMIADLQETKLEIEMLTCVY